MTPRERVEQADLIAAADLAADHLERFADREWSVNAGQLDWDCRTTLDHIPNALAGYSNSLASQSRGRMPRLRNGDPEASIADLIGLVRSAARVLSAVTTAVGEDARGFHPAGLADSEGFRTIAMDEILIHTYDISLGMDDPLQVPGGLARKMLDRIFPWAPDDLDPADALLWVNDRLELPGRGRIGSDWYWQCAPLEEWDGERVRRAAPPGWR